MGKCPRCGTRLLPGAIACINCELPIPASPSADATGQPAPPPPYQVPMPYGAPPPPPPYGAPPPPPYGAGPSPYGASPQPYVGPVPYAPGHYPAPWTTNGLAIAGLILSILWLGGLGSLLGVIFGHVSRSQIKKRPQRGAGLSLAALIIGYIGLAGSVALWANIDAIINSNTVQNVVVQEDMHDAASAEHRYAEAHSSFTNSAVDLRDSGFDPSTLSHNTILAAYNSNVGFCLVGAHDGSSTWYLYDTNGGTDLSDFSYPSAKDAEDACGVQGIGAFTPIA